MADTSLVFNILARDKASRTLAKVRNAALSSSSGIKMALGPALQPVLAAATAGAIGFGAALASAGAAVGVFGAVAGAAFGDVKEASDKTDDLREKIRLLEQQAKTATSMEDRAKFTKKAADAQHELNARLALLDPHTRKATVAYGQLKSDWQDFVDANKPAVYGIMTTGMKALGGIIPKLQPLFDVGAQAAKRFVNAISAKVGDGGIDRFIAWLTTNAGPALDNLGTIGKNFGTIIGNLFDRFDSSGQGILKWLADASTRWAEWSKQTEGGGLDKWVTMVEDKGPQVGKLLGDIASAAKNIAQATAPLAPLSLAIAGGLAAVLAALPPGVITTLVAAWIAYSVALKAYHAYMVIVGVATKVWTGVQWLLNVAMSANPVGLIILAIVALIAIIVLIATKTTWFQQLWKWIWGKIGDPVKAVWAWIKDNWKLLLGILTGPIGWAVLLITKNWDKIKGGATGVWKWITTKFNSLVSFFKGIPGKVSGALSGMWKGLTSGFKSAVNTIIRGWNNLSFTIGGGSAFGVSFPSVSFGTPNIPYLAKGGTIDRSGMAIVGERGPELVSLSRGAQVTPLTGRNGGGGGRMVIEIRSGGSGLDDMLVEILRNAIKARGGNVQVVLGRS